MLKKINRIIKHLQIKFTRRFGYLRISEKLNPVWYGNKYGGFYICPQFLTPNSIVYSFGIGEDITFDNEVIENHNCDIFGFDPTPKSIKWITSQNLSSKFHFLAYGISNKSGITDFYLPKNTEYVSGSILIRNELNEKVSVQMKSINDILNELGHKNIDVLKMDIEGSEYDVLDDIMNTPIFIGQILIEFHDRFVENGKKKTREAIKKLKAHGYVISSISESNEEFSFVNKRILK